MLPSRLTRRIVSMPALAPYQPQQFKPGMQFQSDEELARLAGHIGTTLFHAVGTCCMGRADDPLAVVDARLRPRGLRVADASAMPIITSGNTNLPTLMLAERTAHGIRHETLEDTMNRVNTDVSLTAIPYIAGTRSDAASSAGVVWTEAEETVQNESIK